MEKMDYRRCMETANWSTYNKKKQIIHNTRADLSGSLSAELNKKVNKTN